jgi:hypothetical protein
MKWSTEMNTANYEMSSVYKFGHPAYDRRVIEVMRGKAETKSDGWGKLKSLEPISAVYLSARDERSCSLFLEF